MTARARWTPPARLIEMLKAAGDAVDDLSPAMEQFTRLGFDEISQRLSTGDPAWDDLSPATIKRWGPHPIGIGKGGGFASSLRRGWSKHNAVVISNAPHAHLFDAGTREYRTAAGTRTFAYVDPTRSSLKTKKLLRRSRGATKTILRTTTSSWHQTPRAFMYFSRDLIGPSGRAWDIVTAHIARPFETAA